MRRIDRQSVPPLDKSRHGRATFMELEILAACLRSGERMIARQELIIRDLRSQNLPTVASEAFLRGLRETQSARVEKWRAVAPRDKDWRNSQLDD